LFVKDLDLQNGNIKASVANIRKIAAFKDRIYTIIKNSDYSEKLDKYITAFNEVAVLQNKYFTSISNEFKPTALLKEVTKQSIDATVDALTEQGLNSNLIQPIHDILLTNSTTGGSYQDMVNQLREFMTKTDSGVGELERYAKLITTDSINQFSAQYTNIVANDLGLDWFMYDGSLIKTSRAFCEACVKKKYIHRSEFPDLLKGDFPEFKEEGGEIYDKTGLPSGMIEGTNSSNFPVLRGGYNCGHQLIPVSSAVVPEYVKAKLSA